jgi:hypothetical protein
MMFHDLGDNAGGTSPGLQWFKPALQRGIDFGLVQFKDRLEVILTCNLAKRNHEQEKWDVLSDLGGGGWFAYIVWAVEVDVRIFLNSYSEGRGNIILGMKVSSIAIVCPC